MNVTRLACAPEHGSGNHGQAVFVAWRQMHWKGGMAEGPKKKSRYEL